MNDIVGKLRNNEKWTISVQLLVLYVVAVGIFLAVHEICLKVLGAQKDKIAKGSAGLSIAAFLLPTAAYFGGVAALVALAKTTGTEARIAMALVPLFLSLEKHVRAMRERPEERRFQLLGAAGVLAGMGAGAYVFMRHLPIK
jgi:hypothetical protein